jgi:broad specificity phosphatase PhoE
MTTFILVRHAASEQLGHRYIGRSVDTRLTEAGEQQAQALGRYLRGQHLDYIYCSPRRRTRQTAEHIAAAHDLQVNVHAALDEIDIGEWGGQTFAQLETDAAWQLWTSARHLHTAPNGEDMLSVQQRIVACMYSLRQRCTNGVVLLVTHAEVIRCALLYYLGLPIHAYDQLEIQPASQSRLHIDDRHCRLLTLNQSCSDVLQSAGAT